MKNTSEMFTMQIGEANRQGWPHLIIAVDFHGVLVDSKEYNKALEMGANVEQAIEESIYVSCIKPLQKMTLRKDIKLFLYTSTKEEVRQLIGEALVELYGIEFDYLNSSNLNLKPTRVSQDFSEKPYCDILLDNSAGFEYEDWKDLGMVINDYYIIPKKHGDS